MSFSSWSDDTLPSTFCRVVTRRQKTTHIRKDLKKWVKCRKVEQDRTKDPYPELLKQVSKLLNVPLK